MDDLIARVRAAKEPDLALVYSVCEALDLTKGLKDFSPEWRNIYRIRRLIDAEAWTEAALAMVDYCLPGCEKYLWIFGARTQANLTGEDCRSYIANAPTPSLAIMLALLLAVEEMRNG